MLQNPSKYHTNHHLSSHTIMHQNYPLTNNHHLIANTYLPASHHSHVDSNSSLDVGKSFTIAAILGLQQSAIENNRKDCNSVINLSINNNSNSSNNHNEKFHNQNYQSQIEQQQQQQQQQQQHKHQTTTTTVLSVMKASGDITNKMFNDSAIRNTNSVNNLNCDNNNSRSLINNVVQRYLPPTTNAAISIFVQSTDSHKDIHSFNDASSNGDSKATATRAPPTALQSLQKLHQQHTQQAKLVFQREKFKSENIIKKSSLKNKRVRTIFTPEQLERLEAEFERQQYMVGPERLYLAHTLQLTEAQVKVWFQNRRIKWRKHHLEITQQRLALLRQGKLPLSTSEDMDAKEMSENLRLISGNWLPLESDLSVCNESIDTESLADDEDT